MLSEEAGGKFVELTEDQLGNYVALVVGERVLTAPNIQERIPDGRVVIIGLTVEEAQTFASEIRSATGAVRRVDHLGNVQDLSSPYGAAVALVTALHKEEWATVADVLHPDALGELRVNYEGNFVISGDSARTTTDSGNVAAVLIADVLGRRPIASRMEDLTDHDAVALALAMLNSLGARWGGRGASLKPVGAVLDNDDRVHVLLRGDEAFNTPGYSDVTVVTVAPIDSTFEPSWRALRNWNQFY